MEKTIKDKCAHCFGKGYNNKEVTYDVEIPEGINSGQRVRLSGKGGRGKNGGPSGDLFIEIYVQEDSYFTRDDDDVYTILEISPAQAVLGAKIDVRTLTGEVELNIPAGTQAGRKFKLTGKGIKNVRGYGVGDHYVIVKVLIPKTITSKERELYIQLAELNKEKYESDEDIIEKAKRKVKDLFD